MTYQGNPLFDIRALSHLSGVNASTIRTWENRYAVLSPDKSPTGRRLYDEDDVNRLILLKLLVDQGFRIATLSRMPMDDLRRLRQQSSPAERRALQVPLLGAIEAAIDDYDPDLFRRLLGYAIAELAPLTLVETILVPVLRQIGALWAAGKLDVGLEHLLSEVVRSQLMAQISSVRATTRGPTIGFATLSGEAHEFGSLMACYLAATSSRNTLYFGANMPPDQLAASSTRQNVRLIVISSIHVLGFNAREIDILLRALPASVEVWLGCPPLPRDAERTLPSRVTVFHDYATYVDRLSSHVPR